MAIKSCLERQVTAECLRAGMVSTELDTFCSFKVRSSLLYGMTQPSNHVHGMYYC